MRNRLRAISAAAALAASIVAGDAAAGAQQYEVLSASVRSAMATAVADTATFDWSDLDTRAWVRVMTRRVASRFPDEEAARRFLALVRYESMRAGLDPHLVLAVIEVESRFRKYSVSKAGIEGARISVRAPLLAMSKAEIAALSLALGLAPEETVSCYDPSAAGEPCGAYDACLLRARGFEQASPTVIPKI